MATPRDDAMEQVELRTIHRGQTCRPVEIAVWPLF